METTTKLRNTTERYEAESRTLDRILIAQSATIHAERLLSEAVREAREAGETWAIIGRALGTTKQAAQQRFPSEPTA